MALLRSLGLIVAASLAVACGETVTMAARDGGDDLAPLDIPSSPPDAGTPDVTPDAPLPPDDVDPVCANGGTDRCLNFPPGPCADLSDGMARTVRFAGFVRDHAVSCAGRQTSMGPDAVLPLTLTATSDVSVTVNPGNGDTIVAALVPADACGQPMRELACVNGGSSIGGIGVLRVSNVAPGRYAVIIGTVMGVPVGVTATVTPARPRAQGDLCPGVEVVPDGEPTVIDTRAFFSTADHGTSCGYNGQGSLGWVDAVARFTIRETRDVTVTVDGDGEEDLSVEVTRVCGVGAYIIPGCDTGLPARRLMRNLPPGTYWAVVDYRPVRRPDHTLRVAVTTAPPTPPGPAARCPGVAIPTPVNASSVDVDTLAPGEPPACLTRSRANAYFTFVAPSEPGDVLVNVATNAARSDVAFTLTSACGGDAEGACVSPLDRSANSVWGRYADLTPGRTYTVEAATSVVGGQLSVRHVRVPHAVPTAVAGNTTCDGAYVLPTIGGIFTGTTDGATAVAMPLCAVMTSCAGSRGVLYRLDLTERRRVVLILDGMGFDSLVAVLRNDPCPGRNIRDAVACNDDWYSTDAQVDVTLDAGRYWIHAGGCGAAQGGPYKLDVAVLPP